VEVDGDAGVLGVMVARQAEGARHVAPKHLCQVFTVDHTYVFEIHVYRDPASELDRTRT